MHTFIEPGSKFLGQISALDKRAIPEGAFATVDNWLYKKGVLEARGPIKLKTTTGLVTGTYKGSFTGSLCGTLMEFVAIRSSSITKVYKADYGADTAFTEITHTAGQYPDTQFSADGNVCFAIVRDPSDSDLAPFQNTSGWDLLVFSNGTESVCYNPAVGAFSASSNLIQKAWSPGIGGYKQYACFPDFFSLVVSNVTMAQSDADVTIDDNHAHPTTGGLSPYMAFTSAVETDGTDFGEIRLSSGDTIASGTDVVIVYDTVAFADPWSCLKIELYNGSAYKTLYDPTTDDGPVIVDATKSFLQAAFSVDPVDVPNVSYNRIKFSWVAAHAPATSAEIYFMAIMGGGTMTGGWSLGGSNYVPSTRTDSIGIVASDKDGRNIMLMGCQDARNDIPVIVDEKTHYAYDFEYAQPAQAELDKGLSYLCIYGAPAGVETLRLVAVKALASYVAPNWVGTATSGTRNTVRVNTPTINGARPMPDGLNEPIPPCSSMVSASGRLFCGGFISANASGTSFNNDVYFSDQDNAFRMRGLVGTNADGSVNEDSGGRMMFHGEKVVWLTSTATGFQEIDTVLVFSDGSLYSASGRDATSLSRPRRLGYHGTNSPWSVSAYRNTVYWVDQDKQVMKMTNNVIEPIGKFRIDDLTKAIPDAYLGNVCGVVYRDVYHVGFTNATANNKVLSYDTFLDVWTGGSTNYSTTYGRFFGWGDELRFWAQDGTLLEYDSATGTTDHSSTAIVATIVTKELSATLVAKYEYKNPYVIIESDSGKSLTLSITGRQYGQTKSGTVSLTSSNNLVKRAPPQNVGIEDDAAYLTITGSVSARKRLLACGMTATERPGEQIERIE